MWKWARAYPLEAYKRTKWHLSTLEKRPTKVWNPDWRTRNPGVPDSMYIVVPRYISAACAFLLSEKVQLAQTETFGPLPLPVKGPVCGICLRTAKADPSRIEAQAESIQLN